MTDKEVLALRILDWEPNHEVNSSGRVFHPGENKRKKSLPWLRLEGMGNVQTEEELEISLVAGPERASGAFGLYVKLLKMAGGREREHRGWIVNRRLEPMGVAEIAAIFRFDPEKTAEEIEILRSAKLVEWQICPFAVDCGKPVKLSISRCQERAKEILTKFSENREPLKPDPDKHSLDNSDIRARGREAADTPGRTGDFGGSLGGLTAPGPEYLGSGDLGSGGSTEVGGQKAGEGVIGSGDLGSGDLTRAGGGQGVKDPISRTPEDLGKKYSQGGGGEHLPLDFREVLGRLEEMGRLDVENAGIMAENLTQKNDLIRREQMINRAWHWIKRLFPEQLAPRPESPQKAHQDAAGSETTFWRRLGRLWDMGGEREVVEAVRYAQLKRREAARPRSRIREPIRVVIAEYNRRIQAGKKRAKNKSPPP